jgi:hypothetical protein
VLSKRESSNLSKVTIIEAENGVTSFGLKLTLQTLFSIKNSQVVELDRHNLARRYKRKLTGSNPVLTTKNAHVVELVDTLDLGSSVERFAGSSPVMGTQTNSTNKVVSYIKIANYKPT